MIGTPRTSRAAATFAVPKIDSTASIVPTKVTPVVPRKSRAGWKLNRRKPPVAPASAKAIHATNGSLTCGSSASAPSVSAAIAATPAASPSSPSMKLRATFIPTIQKTVKAIATTPAISMSPSPSGSFTKSMRRPAATMTAATTSRPRNCQRARSSKTSSIRPSVIPRSAANAVRVKRDERTSSGMRNGWPSTRSMIQNAKIVTPNASAIARPPGRGIGRGWLRRPPGRSSRPNRSASRPTSGVMAAERRNATRAELTRRRPVTFRTIAAGGVPRCQTSVAQMSGVVTTKPVADLGPEILPRAAADDDPNMTALHEELFAIRAPDLLQHRGCRRTRRDRVSRGRDVERRHLDRAQSHRSSVHHQPTPRELVVLIELGDPLVVGRARERRALVDPAVHRLPRARIEAGLAHALRELEIRSEVRRHGIEQVRAEADELARHGIERIAHLLDREHAARGPLSEFAGVGEIDGRREEDEVL